MLIEIYGIQQDKIIPFWVYTERELWKIKMKSYDLENIRGLIFGNSNATYGYLEKELSIPFINLSVPSQDLYYDYAGFKRCLDCYGEHLKRLEYIVIDLYDYVESNADCSLSSNILNYLYCGGIYDEHNFRKNKNYKNSLNDEMFMQYGIMLKNDFRLVMEKYLWIVTQKIF